MQDNYAFWLQKINKQISLDKPHKKKVKFSSLCLSFLPELTQTSEKYITPLFTLKRYRQTVFSRSKLPPKLFHFIVDFAISVRRSYGTRTNLWPPVMFTLLILRLSECWFLFQFGDILATKKFRSSNRFLVNLKQVRC